METVKTKVLSEEEVEKLSKLCKGYREEQKKESIHKKNKEAYGKEIKSFLGDNFDGEISIETEEYTGTVRYKIEISFVANKELIISKGLYDELYKPSQSHKLTIG